MEPTYPLSLADTVKLAERFPTPFHLYDERRVRETASGLAGTMRAAGLEGFQNYFAVKALPNPEIVRVLASEGMGVDCSSLAELAIAEMCGLRGERVMFTSNNTTMQEFAYAHQLGAIINFDDKTLVTKYLEALPAPAVASCRFNPGNIEFEGVNEAIIGKPREAKFGMPYDDLVTSFAMLKSAGVTRFGLHTMLLSNELGWHNHIEIARTMFETAKRLAAELEITFEFINLGGGIGVAYLPHHAPFELDTFAAHLADLYNASNLEAIGSPRVVMENGRYITADAGYIVTRAVNRKDTHKTYIGVDATMSDLMRPGMYGSYHHISVLGKPDDAPVELVDVVGSLCENNDKFAVDRELPVINEGDLLVVHTTGAHGHAMGFQYNGKLRHAEIVLAPDGTSRLIRRAETLDDYFATLTDKGEYHVPTN